MPLTGARRLGAIAACIVMIGGAALLLAGTVQADAGAATPPRRAVLGPGTVTVRIQIDRSHFSKSRIRVRPHTTVQFVVVNHDPIGHEFIIGDADVHARHESGHEASHPPVPGEVSIPPLTTGTTTFELHEPGTVEYACHLPGHLQYGMVGEVVVVAG
jgi:uncharacterized cupredoxin-like copper-binding protein